MTTLFIILFYLTLLLILNSFVFYPLFLFILNKLNPVKSKTKEKIEPTVSFLIAAYNEEKVIARRIENIANLNYDFSKLEVFIGSDKSSDSTNQILEESQAKYPWLKIFLSEERRGKAGILNELINKVNNEIIVFTDANTEFQKDTLYNLVQDFADEKVGGVCGGLIFVDNELTRREGVEETKYWEYETFIKSLEGKCGISLAANGGIFAIRKKLYKNIPVKKAVTDDLFISLSVISQGYEFTYREDAVAYEDTGKNLSVEYKRKVRFSATNFQTLVNFKHLLFNKNIFLGYAFFSHKVTRWILPMLLAAAFIFSALLYKESFFIFIIFSLQILFYVFAAVGFLSSLLKIQNHIFSLPYFFVLSNLAIAAGFIKFIKKEHSVIWTSTER